VVASNRPTTPPRGAPPLVAPTCSHAGSVPLERAAILVALPTVLPSEVAHQGSLRERGTPKRLTLPRHRFEQGAIEPFVPLQPGSSRKAVLKAPEGALSH